LAQPAHVLPSLLLRPTFRSFVLADFAANRTAAQPILYRLSPHPRASRRRHRGDRR
jgi:hypothetical protein